MQGEANKIFASPFLYLIAHNSVKQPVMSARFICYRLDTEIKQHT